MAYEQRSNGDTTTLRSGYTAGGSSLDVNASAGDNGGFPSAANFRVRVYSPTTPYQTKARFKVTAVPDSHTLTITPEGLDANCATGDIVENVHSADGIAAMLADANQVGSYASMPASGPFVGGEYKATDIGHNFRWNGTIWVPIGGPTCVNLIDVPPSSANAMDDEFYTNSLDAKWTTLNAQTGQSVITNGDSFVTLYSPYTIQNHFYGIAQNAPGGNWKVRAKIAWDNATYVYFGAGMFVRRTTGGEKTLQFNLMEHAQGSLSCWLVRMGTSFAFSSEVDLYQIYQSTYYFEVEYDGTNIIWRTSQTGRYWSQVYSEATASFLGGAAEQVGICIHPYNNNTGDSGWSGAASFDWFRRIA